jgi:hypothetical protein
MTSKLILVCLTRPANVRLVMFTIPIMVNVSWPQAHAVHGTMNMTVTMAVVRASPTLARLVHDTIGARKSASRFSEIVHVVNTLIRALECAAHWRDTAVTTNTTVKFLAVVSVAKRFAVLVNTMTMTVVCAEQLIQHVLPAIVGIQIPVDAKMAFN